MPTSIRMSLVACLALSLTACCCGPGGRHLRQSQRRSMELWRQNQSLMSQGGNYSAEKQALEQQLAGLSEEKADLESRIANLQAENGDLQQRYIGLVNSVKNQGNPLSPEATEKLQGIDARLDGFEFDPETGVSKFHSDLLFASGSSEIREEAKPVLKELAEILNGSDAQQFNILVVGHTDDRRVAKASTKAKHTDNWDLSGHRASSVVRQLGRDGIKDGRMGFAGYGPHQPLESNSTETARQRNRRVEIFVLAPNASVAGWDHNQPE